MARISHFVVLADHPALAGHFPDLPVVPGSLILEHVIAAWGRPVSGIPFAKFHVPLGPDQPVEVRFEPAREPGLVRFSGWRDGELICSGLLSTTAP